MAISGELLDPDMLEGGTRVFSALAAIWEEGQVLSGGISYLPLTRVFQLMPEEHRAEESEVCWAWEMGRIAALLCTGTDPGLERTGRSPGGPVGGDGPSGKTIEQLTVGLPLSVPKKQSAWKS